MWKPHKYTTTSWNRSEHGKIISQSFSCFFCIQKSNVKIADFRMFPLNLHEKILTKFAHVLCAKTYQLTFHLLVLNELSLSSKKSSRRTRQMVEIYCFQNVWVLCKGEWYNPHRVCILVYHIAFREKKMRNIWFEFIFVNKVISSVQWHFVVARKLLQVTEILSIADLRNVRKIFGNLTCTGPL